jgi:hypothetical protein
MFRANKPGSVRARTSRDPRERVARRVRGFLPLVSALPGLSAIWAPLAQGAHMVRSEVDASLHRLANYIKSRIKPE